jgi:hypothetical protein
MASSTKSIVKSSYAGSWNVQCAEMEFDYSQVGDMSSVDYDLIGKLSLPANSYIIDIQVHGITLWVSGSTAAIIIGDDDDDNGFVESTNLKATDLLVGEANTIEHPGGKAGAYIASEQRKLYSASARNIISKVTLGNHGTAATAGKTRVLVLYTCPPVDSVKP